MKNLVEKFCLRYLPADLTQNLHVSRAIEYGNHTKEQLLSRNQRKECTKIKK